MRGRAVRHALHLLRQRGALTLGLSLAVAAACLVVGAGSAWVVQGWRAGAALAACQASAARARADSAETAIDELQIAARAVAQAATGVAAAGQRAAQVTEGARRRWQEEIAARPLAADCRRDEGRQQALREAVERAAGGQ